MNIDYPNNDELKKTIKSYLSLILAKLQTMAINSSLHDWKRIKTTKLKTKIQGEIERLQNPSSCLSRKKLICKMKNNCGFGCQMHHLMYCLVTSYFTKRVLLIDSKDWSYNKNGLDTYFKPISNCTLNSHIPKVNDGKFKIDLLFFCYSLSIES